MRYFIFTNELMNQMKTEKPGEKVGCACAFKVPKPGHQGSPKSTSENYETHKRVRKVQRPEARPEISPRMAPFRK